MLSEGIAESLQQGLGNKATVTASFTRGHGSLKVAWAEGEGDVASAGGIRFHLCTSGATGIAPVQSIPTTAAQWLLYNPIGSGVSMFFDELGSWLVSGTAGAGATLLYALCNNQQLPTSRPATSVANVILENANPNSKRGSRLIAQTNQTLLGNLLSWKPLAWMNPAGTLVGQTQMINQDVRGKIMLTPDSGIALAVISPTGTSPLFAPTGIHREYDFPGE